MRTAVPTVQTYKQTTSLEIPFNAVWNKNKKKFKQSKSGKIYDAVVFGLTLSDDVIDIKASFLSEQSTAIPALYIYITVCK